MAGPRIAGTKVLRLIRKWLNAGVIEDSEIHRCLRSSTRVCAGSIGNRCPYRDGPPPLQSRAHKRAHGSRGYLRPASSHFKRQTGFLRKPVHNYFNQLIHRLTGKRLEPTPYNRNRSGFNQAASTFRVRENSSAEHASL